MSLSCLLGKDPAIINLIGTLVEYEAFNLPVNGIPPTFKNVYNSLRKQGLEVDIQTMGEVYKNRLSSKLGYSTIAEVDWATMRTVNRIVGKMKARLKVRQMGDDKPSVSAAKHLASLVQIDHATNPTIQKIYQERLKKVLRRKLKIKGKLFPQQDIDEMLSEALMTEDNNIFLFNGQGGYMGNAQDLFDEMQQEIEAIATEMENAQFVDSNGQVVQQGSYGAAQMREYANEIQQAAYDLFLSQREVEKVLQEIMQQAGFSRTIRVAGVDKYVTDWNKVLNTSYDTRQTVRQVFESRFSGHQLDRIVDFFSRQLDELVQHKMADNLQKVAPHAKRTDIDRLAAMQKLGAFQTAERKMIYDLLGVESLDQQLMLQVEELMKAMNQGMALYGFEFATVFSDTITRQVRIIAERAQEKHGGLGLKALRNLAMFTQWGSSVLLSNIGNSSENFTSGIGAVMEALASNPKALLPMMKAFATTWVDVARGGVREGHEQSNVYADALNNEDNTSIEVNKGWKKWVYGTLNIWQRLVLAATDAGFKAAIMRSVEHQGFRQLLRGQGLSSGEAAMVMNEVYYGNRAQIESAAKQMIDLLKGAGIPVAEGKWQRMAAQMAVANMLSEGQFFPDTLNRLEAAGKLAPGKKDKIHIDKAVVDILRNAAAGTSSRAIGHKQDVRLARIFDRKVVQMRDQANRARKSGNYRRMMKLEAGALGTYTVLRFRSGALRWMFLNLYKSTPVPLLVTLIWDMAIRGQHKLLNAKRLAESFDQLEAQKAVGQTAETTMYNDLKENLEKAFAVRQRLFRSVVQPVVAYTLWRTVLGPAMAGMLERVCDENTEDCLKEKMAVIKENGWDGLLTKAMPIMVQTWLQSMVKMDRGGKFSPQKEVPTLEDFYAHPEYWDNNLMRMISINAGQDPIWGLVSDVSESVKFGDMTKAREALGNFVGRVTMVNYPSKAYDINRRYINSFKGISNRMQGSEYRHYKPDGFIDGFMRQQTHEDLYKLWKDRAE